MDAGVPGEDATIIAPNMSSRVLFWLGFPLVGAVLGWVVKAVAGWAASVPWLPLPGPVELISSLPELPVTLGSIAVGVLGGVVIAFVAEHEYVKLAVADNSLLVGVGESLRTVDRAETSAVFFDGKDVVVLGRRSEVLIRATAAYGRKEGERVAGAFRQHDWPWSEAGDPHRSAFRRWVDGAPELPASANAVMRARAKALEKDDKEDVVQLRDELAKLGVVVRDEKKRQFWRRIADDA